MWCEALKINSLCLSPATSKQSYRYTLWCQKWYLKNSINWLILFCQAKKPCHLINSHVAVNFVCKYMLILYLCLDKLRSCNYFRNLDLIWVFFSWGSLHIKAFLLSFVIKVKVCVLESSLMTVHKMSKDLDNNEYQSPWLCLFLKCFTLFCCSEFLHKHIAYDTLCLEYS